MSPDRPTSKEPPCPGSLCGVRVVDFTHFLSGPLCTMMLADLGADVIKVESPHLPDPMRTAGRSADASASEPISFHTLNRGKRSLAADLKQPDDRARVQALIDAADVVVENFRPGVADRLGIGYGQVRERNPRIVYASLSGFGDRGPLESVGGYDILAQAASGIMSVTGYPDSEPLKAGVPVTDVGAGLVLAVGVLAALRSRDRDGVGQKVSTSLLAAGLTYGVWEASEYWGTGQIPQRLGNVHRSLAPYQVLTAQGGTSFVIAANNDRAFSTAIEVFGCTSVASDARFATNAARLNNREALIAVLQEATDAAPAATWVERLNELGVPAGEVLDYGEALEHEQPSEIGMVVDLPGDDGTIRALGNPLRMQGTPVAYRSSGPELHDGTDEVGWLDHEG